MKSYRIIAAIILIPMIRGTFATELAVVGRYTAPPASLEGGIGGDVQIRHVLFGDVYGMASLGYTTWGIQDASVSVSSPCSHWGLDQSRTGSIDDYHAGIGLGLRRPLPAGWSGQRRGSVRRGGYRLQGSQAALGHQRHGLRGSDGASIGLRCPGDAGDGVRP